MYVDTDSVERPSHAPHFSSLAEVVSPCLVLLVLLLVSNTIFIQPHRLSEEHSSHLVLEHFRAVLLEASKFTKFAPGVEGVSLLTLSPDVFSSSRGNSGRFVKLAL